ncbi:MAG: acetyl-CoA carboxylase biotin carboxyl carrier protein [Verrucomicrobiota bacterium]
MNIKEIASVADLMTKHDLSEFSIESEDMKLVIRRDRAPQAAPQAPPPPVVPASPQPTAADAREQAQAQAAEETSAKTIDSPIVGTFYEAPAPGSAAFVSVGDEVDEETVVCIVEAMKVMNEVKAECKGRIKKRLVENAQPVEYGQPIFEIE